MKKRKFLKEKCSSNFAVPNFFSFVKQNQPFYVILLLRNVKTKKKRLSIKNSSFIIEIPIENFPLSAGANFAPVPQVIHPSHNYNSHVELPQLQYFTILLQINIIYCIRKIRREKYIHKPSHSWPQQIFPKKSNYYYTVISKWDFSICILIDYDDE